jgi:hypothetical protein
MIGRDLGIIGSHDSTMHLVSEFTAVTDRGPTIEIGIAMFKPWYDERELETPNTAEVREYRLRWWDKGFAYDDYKPVQRVTVGP